MFTTVLRVIIIYIIVLIVIRLMGKRQLGEMQPFELVITLIIADLATIPMAEPTLPLFYGLIPVMTLLLIHYIICVLAKKSLFFRKTLTGKAIIIISPNGIEHKAMQDLSMNMNDLQESLRIAGYLSPDEIQFAIVETNGQISFIPKAENAPATNGDLKISAPEKQLPVILISEGMLCRANLKIMNLNEAQILNFIKTLTSKEYKLSEICLFTIDIEGKAYLQAFDANAVSGNLPYIKEEN